MEYITIKIKAQDFGNFLTDLRCMRRNRAASRDSARKKSNITVTRKINRDFEVFDESGTPLQL